MYTTLRFRGGVFPLLLVLSLVVAACGDNDSAEPATNPESADTGDDLNDEATSTPGAAFAADAYTTDLSGVCPDPVVIQTGWFPEPSRGHIYQMIGDGGEVDAENGTYTGPLGSTGVDLEVRIGGPFVGDQANTAIIYQDDDILLAEIGTDESIEQSGKFPSVGVVAPLEIDPQILMWDPATYDIDSWEDIRETGAPVLVFGGDAVYVQYLVRRGLISEDQVDESYDGSPSRWVSSNGRVIQQGFAVNEPFQYENLVEEWKKPVDFLLVADSGFRTYQNALAVRADLLEESTECLQALVPIIQQATIDYVEGPEAVNEELLTIVDELASFWTLTAEGNAHAAEQLVELGLVSNGPDDTLGNFDEERVQELIEVTSPIFEDQNDDFDPNVTPGDVMTNEFIDPGIGMR